MNAALSRNQLSISALIVVFYIDGTTQTIQIPLSNVDANDVTVDDSAGVWYFRKGTVHEAVFTIGRGVRVPEGKEYWGPMMVYNPQDPNHTNTVAINVKDLEQGKLLP
ncbi:MAG: hypothetical protein M3Q73_02380 [bacterium]|nr:hypothetical protein [bacterium]